MKPTGNSFPLSVELFPVGQCILFEEQERCNSGKIPIFSYKFFNFLKGKYHKDK